MCLASTRISGDRMPSSLYVALSGQVSLQRRLETIAHNIANMNTVGFRATGIQFTAELTKVGDSPVAYVSSGQDFISRQTGNITKSGNPLDVAVQGSGWLSIRNASGVAYTRDGRMQLSETGELQTINGYSVLDAGNAPIIIDPNAGPPIISRDGMITQNGKQVSAIGLFDLPPEASLTRTDNSAVLSDRPATPILEFNQNGIVQGFTEDSNVNPVNEMTRLISITRTFDSLSAAISQSENGLNDAIKTLAASN